MKTAAEVMRDNPHLIPYRVELIEDGGEEDSIVFDCFAEDDDHAIEQAENAYPNCVIRAARFFPSRD
jgi:hypothetical protein